VTPLNDAADRWWRLGLDDTLKRANRRTYGQWLYDICQVPPPIIPPTLALPAASLARASARLHELAPAVTRWICFNTGASRRWEEKRWKAHHYVELARIIGEAIAGVKILLLGGAEDASFNRQLLAASDVFMDGGTDNSLPMFASLVASCDWMLTGDSLGYHVACAVRTPALCLVGPTAPWELDTFGLNHVSHAPLDCIACYHNQCPKPTTCMDTLTPTAVWEQACAWQARLNGAVARGRSAPGLLNG
jgi:heptosyltransferase-2